jgi:hypothetical protein
MLDADVTQTGVAVSRSDKSNYYYAVQMYGRPKSQMSQFRITNDTSGTVRYELSGRTFPLPPLSSRTHGRCRPAELTLQRPGRQGSPTVEPGDGDQYTVAQDEAGQLVSREG